MEDFLTRETMLLGKPAVDRLHSSRVAVVGIGGVGSAAVEALCRAGVGELILCDRDVVSQSNCNRQLCALRSTIGRSKAEVMAERCRDINPDCNVRTLCMSYGEKTREELFSLGPDYIIDAIDMVTAKIDLIVTARSRGVPILSAMGTGNKLDPTRLEFEKLEKTSVCPLCRIMRRELGARGIKGHRVIYSKETPIKPITPPDGDRRQKSLPGSVSWVPPVAGMMLAGRCVLDLTGCEGGQAGD